MQTRERMTVSRYEQFETSPETIEQELLPAVCKTRERMTVSRYEQFETSPETIEQELLPAVCEQRKIKIKENYRIDV